MNYTSIKLLQRERGKEREEGKEGTKARAREGEGEGRKEGGKESVSIKISRNFQHLGRKKIVRRVEKRGLFHGRECVLKASGAE